jgi:serine/threonine protein kinase
VTPKAAARERFELGLGKFLEEARVLARFREHPGIVSVLNLLPRQRHRLPGDELPGRRHPARLPGQPGRHAAVSDRAGAAGAGDDAMRDLHQTGLLHRDISPDNLYLTSDGAVKVLDFGAARNALANQDQYLTVILKPATHRWSNTPASSQGPGPTCTPWGRPLHLLTGKRPPDVLERNQRGTPLPSDFGASTPPGAQAALLRALALQPEERFQSMAELKRSACRRRGSGDPDPDGVRASAPVLLLSLWLRNRHRCRRARRVRPRARSRRRSSRAWWPCSACSGTVADSWPR